MAPKERFNTRRPPYPLRILRKPYLERYEPQAFSQYDGRRGNVVEHVSKFIDTLDPTQQTRTCVFGSFLNPYVTECTPSTLA